MFVAATDTAFPAAQCLRCWTVQLLAILRETLDDILSGAAHNPLRKRRSRFRVRRPRANQEMSRIQQRVISVVRGGFEDGGLTGQVGGKREKGASIGERVLVEQDGRRQSLERERDILVVPRPLPLSAIVLPLCAPRNGSRANVLFCELACSRDSWKGP